MKKAIFTFTPNPALDIGGLVNNLHPNEKAYVMNEIRAPGGSGINSSRILSRLKIPVTVSGFIGGPTGAEVQSLLKAENIKTNFISIQNNTRINVTISNAKDHNQMRLSFQGPRIHAREKRNLFDLLEQQNDLAYLVLGGSLPVGFSTKDLIHLIQAARRKNIASIVDCPGSILAQVLTANPLFIKPNLKEFQELTKSHVSSIGAVIEKSKKLLQQVQAICVSSVEEGALLMTQKQIYFGRTPKVKVRSTVGAGDSMVGAMLAQLYKENLFNQDTLRWGLAAAAATLSQSGIHLGSSSDIKKLYKETVVQTIK